MGGVVGKQTSGTLTQTVFRQGILCRLKTRSLNNISTHRPFGQSPSAFGLLIPPFRRLLS